MFRVGSYINIWLLPLLWLGSGLSPALADASIKGSPPTLLILGDSISAGYGLEPGQGWVALLDQHLKQQTSPLQVINASVSGDTTSGGLSRLPGLLAEFQPTLLVIELGGNDGLRGTPLKLIEANLLKLVELGQQAGAQVVLFGMRIPPNYGPRYSEGFYRLYARVAERSGAGLLPFFLDGVGGIDHLMQTDGIHPNRDAQPLLLKQALTQLQPMLEESAEVNPSAR